MRCRACNSGVTIAAGDRVGFRDTCDRCDADLHVCLNCSHHDPSAYNECREGSAERVGDRERANRCDWFSPSDASGGEVDLASARQRSALDELFKK
jgi:hypothetical protein